ncbi:hypothetical protein FHS61_000067 [Altererythrobacter atlanticus]|uniref:Ancillary SecYEG translocon subunit/Cell division coordinator CpoB TPR domain-containing protein n=1 Tax=Croceibacterium atlanticum TaxID=1267766 RepID=A0A0F7KSP7_9SPHN|nr:tetratricopeptide repeat protein [Croceibacterium atlanticum]AKH42297.1 hypothetical protein WYH_01252 [Croceibacterium atlanticum]MBB5731074.1 hypothetical protein [Croceibacterium atlanticum]
MALTPEEEKKRAEKLAARQQAEKDMLMREVDEAVRQDKVGQTVKKWGIPVGVALVLGLAAFGGWLFWTDRQEGVLEGKSEELVTALDELDAGRASQADQELAALIGEGASGVAVPAKLVRAGIALQDGKAQEAIRLYDEVAADGDAPEPYRDLAAVRSVAANYDNLKPQEIIDRLKPLAVPGNPWFGSAGELVGMAYLDQDKPDLAGPLFAEIAKSDTVPETLKSRARQLAGLLGYDAIEDVDAALAEIQQEAGPGAAAQ